MPSLSIPIATWQDNNGNWFATTLDGIIASSCDTNIRGATDQIKKHLEWMYRKQPYMAYADFSAPVVDHAQIDVRARFETNEGEFPGETPINARYTYVWGRRQDGSIGCVLPTLGVRFNCRKQMQIKALVRDQVIRAMSEATTSEIAQSLFACELETDTVHVKIKPALSAATRTYPLKALPEIAVALGDRHVRRQYSKAWNRQAAIDSIVDSMLSRSTSILLLGESGVGKSSTLVDAVRQAQLQIKKQSQTDASQPKIPINTQRFWMTNASRMIAGMQYLGQWEERCERVIEELSEIQGMLCIENLLALARTGSDEPTSSVAAFMRSFMERGELRLIAEATPRELESLRRLLPGFDTQFQIIRISPMSRGRAISVLNSMAEHYRKMERIETDQAAVALTWHLHQRFMPYDPFPGKCAVFWRRLFDNRSDQLSRSVGSANIDRIIRTDDVIVEFVQNTGLPEFLVRDEILLDFENVRQHFQDKIIGQPHACQAVADTVITFKAAMNDPNRPIGVLLFCGPTGVGKTEMAKTLSRYLFGSGDEDKDQRLIRLDMSEYAAPGAAERLLTATDGGTGQWIESIRRQPFTVLLLDEIEKANHEVFDTLMNVFDEGRLTDRMGRVTNFCSTVILMTSNLGTSRNQPIGFDDQAQIGYEKEVRQFFRPEFFNRIDSVVTFGHLESGHIFRIAEMEIQKLRKREGLDRRNIRISVQPEVARQVAKQGYDRKLGARPLQRVIEQRIVTPLARWIAENPDAQSMVLSLEMVDGEIACHAGSN